MSSNKWIWPKDMELAYVRRELNKALNENEDLQARIQDLEDERDACKEELRIIKEETGWTVK